MSYPINYPTPQGANIQIFNGGGDPTASNNFVSYDWVKPQGASFVWFTLIGGGGAGDSAGGFGGGSGAVTNFMGPAFLIPDELKIQVGARGVYPQSGKATSVYYQLKDGSGYLLLNANGGTTGGVGAGGTASTSNYFSAMGFFQSVAGQNGAAVAQSASSTTFLSGGGSGGNGVTANYGYTINTGGNGFFQMQPIIVGVGASDVGGAARKGGIGCGGSAGGFGDGGAGLCVIITW